MSAINEALKDAQESATSLGMCNIDPNAFKIADIRTLQTKAEKIVNKDIFNVNKEPISLENSIPENDKEEINNVFSNLDSSNLKNYTDKMKRNDTPYLKLSLNNKTEMTVLKSSLCWLYAKKAGRLSVDRIMRVRGPNEQKHPKRRIK
ncbi:unnamed protein product [Psylliodes chrysocephalus]|uniref:Uncharacterized protein n=1 Tax=Psylliodes chrysocephalus TaxID=3402493 RepID=A0A9P0CLV1_9CUCU|nr:unnamed protein product [Psylliodes chrysocephala]